MDEVWSYNVGATTPYAGDACLPAAAEDGDRSDPLPLAHERARRLSAGSDNALDFMSEPVDVAIIGAGPYGLSIAAHLAKNGVNFRIFGRAMHTWRTSMPEGMVLKSEGNASNLYDPAGEMPLSRFCADRGLPYQDTGLPVPLATFIDYGLAFQRRFVPGLEDRLVAEVKPTAYGFDLHLEGGEVASTRRVIIAAGIRAYEYMPPQLRICRSNLRRTVRCT